MIEAKHLTHYYGDYQAVSDVSFSVGKTTVVGFLGPNGAGKSTTMRILAGFLIPSTGQASISGFDVVRQPIEARKCIGYLPENCPLYPGMKTVEYLRFRAGLKGIHGQNASKRIEEVVDRCWLDDVRGQLVGTLSRGYRQRVGLADALLADPKVLILDEPTAGLDPSQIVEMRKLIRELGRHHTVLLSSHILSEVENTCDRAIIIARGRVLASGTLDDLCVGGQTLEQRFLRLVETAASAA